MGLSAILTTAPVTPQSHSGDEFQVPRSPRPPIPDALGLDPGRSGGLGLTKGCVPRGVLERPGPARGLMPKRETQLRGCLDRVPG